jgi:hypothetical protein
VREKGRRWPARKIAGRGEADVVLRKGAKEVAVMGRRGEGRHRRASWTSARPSVAAEGRRLADGMLARRKTSLEKNKGRIEYLEADFGTG